MKVLKVVNLETGKVDAYDMNVVRSYPSVESLQKMREHKDHASISMVIEFVKEMPYSMAWYEVDKFDLIVEG